MDESTALSTYLMKYGIGRTPRESNFIFLGLCICVAIIVYIHAAGSAPSSSINKTEIDKEMQQMDSPSKTN
jgi:hypothetical protein